MTDPKLHESSGSEETQQEEQRITQNRPSHMNQGNQAFRPGQQKGGLSRDQLENQKTGEQQEKSSRKVS